VDASVKGCFVYESTISLTVAPLSKLLIGQIQQHAVRIREALLAELASFEILLTRFAIAAMAIFLGADVGAAAASASRSFLVCSKLSTLKPK